MEITRARTIRREKSVEVVYGIASLSAVWANAEILLTASRDHWKIESELHDTRDVTLREDAGRVRSGTAPQVLAVLRNAIVHLLAAVDAQSLPEAIEQLQIYPARAQELIGISQSV